MLKFIPTNLKAILPVGRRSSGASFCSPSRPWLGLSLALHCWLVFVGAFASFAQSNPPPVSIFRSYVNDISNAPLVTVTITGASNVSCYTIEEDLPGPASAVIVSNGGVWLPSLGAVRWGPFFNTVSNSVSYRLTGPAGSYPINGGTWMDGEWFFSPGLTMVPILGPGVPSAPPQVATPVFTPGSGSNVPVSVTIVCATPGASIYYTLDGSLPTTNSAPYTNALYLPTSSTVRAVAFTDGFTPSVAAFASYGPPAALANVQVTRSVNTSSPAAPVVTFNVLPGTNASCLAVTETLPTGLGATNVTAGGNYMASNNLIVWGPFFGTNAQTLSYQPVGQQGIYPVQAAWSVDGVGGQGAPTNIVLAGNGVPTQPLQVAAPTFTPPSGANVPTDVAISCATPGATIYYTLDGSLPTQSSIPYSSSIYLASASTIRALAFTNGFTPSAASDAFYGPPATTANAQVTRSVDASSPTAPVVTFNVLPGAGASCVALTESLPPGVVAASVTAGGQYIASNNVVLWGPFFGSNALALSYVAMGIPGAYPAQASWSVDGVGGSEAVGTNIVLAYPPPGFPFAPQQEPTPILSPSFGSNLPISVSISSSDSQAQIYYTTDGTLPTQSSLIYTTPLEFRAPTALRAVSFRTGYLPSVSAVGYYVAPPPTNSLSLARSISGNGTIQPSVTLTATPLSNVSCYAVTETLAPVVTPSGLAAGAVWNPTNNTISWGPFLDNQPRAFTYQLTGPSVTFQPLGQGSFDGYSAPAAGAESVSLNTDYLGENTNILTCNTGPISYFVDINPAPGIIMVDTASGTVSWGDGTVSNVTQPVMSLQHLYANSGTNVITLSVYWTGYDTNGQFASGNGTKTDTVEVFSSCGPLITNQPTNQVVLAGTTAQFAVGASSEFALLYQWYFNQTNRIIVGGTSATLTLANLTSGAEGSYSVVVTDAYGSTNSAVATLTVASNMFASVTRNTNGSITLKFEGLPNTETRLWAATNLSYPVFWQPIYTNTSTTTNGTWLYTDTNAIYFPERYYYFTTP